MSTTCVDSGTYSIEPKVVMVEEAGQVLEAHILASLVPSGISQITST